jgi:hypothetical protein
MNPSPYSYGLLNDLHHHFPDLLYRSERFQTVQEVLQYVIDVAQESPYERERQRYRRMMPPLEPEEDQEQEEEQEQKEDQESNPSAQRPLRISVSHPYAFPPSSMTPPSSFSSASPFVPSLDPEPSRALDPDSIFRALLEPRPIARPSNRFRLSVPLELSSFLSSSFAPSSLQSLSQLSDILRPVVVRPTEQHLAENTYIYRSEVAHQDNCAICQDPMEAGQETRTILACSHCFHRECIDRWFQEHVRCPTCRRDVRDP